MNLVGKLLLGNLRHFKPCCVTRLFYHDKLREKSEGNDKKQTNGKQSDRTVREYMYKN